MVPIHPRFHRPAVLHLGHEHRPLEVRVPVLSPRLGHLSQVVLLDEAILPLNQPVVSQDGERGLVTLEEVDEVPLAQIFPGKLTCAPHCQARVVDAGGPPAVASPSRSPYDFAKS